MIPKIIHYCWFGGNPLPEDALRCIASWKKYCPDYEIKEWNEKNFDLDCCPYVREAYDAKKWAFITDYVRLNVLVNEGGIYMDTDVEVLKPLDCFLSEKAFSGFENPEAVPTGIMAAERNHPFFIRLLNYYNDKHFLKEDGSLDLTTNVVTITNMCLEAGLKLNNEKQIIEDFTLYPKEYFCPKSYKTGKIIITENTYTIHHFCGSWQSDEHKKLVERNRRCMEKYGLRLGRVIGIFVNFPFYVGIMKEFGFKESLKHMKIFIRDMKQKSDGEKKK